MLSERLLKMLDSIGFSDLYDLERVKNKELSNIECYERLEIEHTNYFNRRRYSCYDSFRKVRERRHHDKFR